MTLTATIEENRRLRLTEREVEYLSLDALGYTNIEIAEILSVTKYAPKKVFENIFKKLNAKNRTNAAIIAYIHGIISLEILLKMEQKAKNILK